MCNAWNHVDGCTCGGGWGSGGILDHSDGSQKLSKNYLLTDSFCRASRCSSCGQEIYVVRHNGGVVYFDELGQPWPKHDCSYSDDLSRREKEVDDGMSKWLADLSEPLIGVIVKVSIDDSKFVNVFCSDNEIRKMRLHVSFSLEDSLGEFVIFSSLERKLVRPYLNIKTVIEIDDEQILERKKPISKEEFIKSVPKKEHVHRWNCKFCPATFIDHRSLDRHYTSHSR